MTKKEIFEKCIEQKQKKIRQLEENVKGLLNFDIGVLAYETNYCPNHLGLKDGCNLFSNCKECWEKALEEVEKIND